jgi:hypothetical protein
MPEICLTASVFVSDAGVVHLKHMTGLIELDLDTAGYVQGMEDSTFSTPQELGRLLAESSACQKCIVKQLFRYALGREATASDQTLIEDLVAKFRASGYRFRELIIALVTSDLFLQKARS